LVNILPQTKACGTPSRLKSSALERHTLVANDKYAKERNFQHRIVNVDADFYGDDAVEVRQMLSIAYATKLICLDDPAVTSTASRVGTIQHAACAGLEIDAVRACVRRMNRQKRTKKHRVVT
jgi:hypothetical protein